MATPRYTDAAFIEAWHRSGGSPVIMAQQTGLVERGIYSRRARLESQGVTLNTLSTKASDDAPDWAPVFERERPVNVQDGSVVVFSDAHYWPGQVTVAHRALLAVLKRLKPVMVIANGDITDGAVTNRHDPVGWSKKPGVKAEIEAAQQRLHEIVLATKVKRPGFLGLYWNIGNHDLNFERRLCTQNGEFEGMPMMRLNDHFPEWTMQWSLRVNGHTMIKHRWHNGIHAAYNNALKGGLSIVTGHLHRLCITPWGDYNGRRYGVDTGTLSDATFPQFEYLENNSVPWCSGFAVLTFKDGRLLPPELVEVIDGRAYFRGEVLFDGTESP